MEGQVRDTIFITDSKNFNQLILHKSTLQDAIIKFGNYLKVDTVLESTMTADFLGGGSQTFYNYHRLFYFYDNSLIIETPKELDTICRIDITSPFSLRTFDGIILGKTTFGNVMKYSEKHTLIYRHEYNGKEYSYIKLNNIYYGINSEIIKLKPRYRKKIITNIMLYK